MNRPATIAARKIPLPVADSQFERVDGRFLGRLGNHRRHFLDQVVQARDREVQLGDAVPGMRDLLFLLHAIDHGDLHALAVQQVLDRREAPGEHEHASGSARGSRRAPPGRWGDARSGSGGPSSPLSVSWPLSLVVRQISLGFHTFRNSGQASHRYQRGTHVDQHRAMEVGDQELRDGEGHAGDQNGRPDALHALPARRRPRSARTAPAPRRTAAAARPSPRAPSRRGR